MEKETKKVVPRLTADNKQTLETLNLTHDRRSRASSRHSSRCRGKLSNRSGHSVNMGEVKLSGRLKRHADGMSKMSSLVSQNLQARVRKNMSL